VPSFRPSHSPARSVELSVRPESLTVAGARLVAAAADLATVRREVDAVAELTARALPLPVVATSAVGLARAWDAAVDAEVGVLGHLAAALESASWAYADVESRLAETAR